MLATSFPYLRLSLTDRCNFDCFYCRPSSRASFLSDRELLDLSEMFLLVKELTSFGIKHVRLTGGEPLLRRGLRSFLEDLSCVPEIECLSMTTNGFYLASFLKDFKKGGIKKINISLDTLKRERFMRLTGVDALARVCDGALMAKKEGIRDVKLNVILVKGFNDDEIEDLVQFACQHQLDVRFIEYFPTRSRAGAFGRSFLPSAFVKKVIEKRYGALGFLGRDPLAGPADYFKIKGEASRIGFISSVTDFFCRDCNRLRLTADGKLYACLHSDFYADLKSPLREKDRQGVSEAIALVVSNKRFYDKLQSSRPFEMSSIGG
jgi:cyclic pyranopterin phosphate synthase